MTSSLRRVVRVLSFRSTPAGIAPKSFSTRGIDRAHALADVGLEE